MDSRVGIGTPMAKLSAGTTRELTVLSVAGIPSDATAVVINVTATRPSARTYLTVWPTGAARPRTSSLNVPAGVTRPNLVVATVGAGGRISLYNNAGSVDVVVDVFGYFSPTGDRYSTVVPSRLLDTRTGVGGYSTKFGSSTTRNVQVRGVNGVPATASAVAVNITPVNASLGSYLTAWPSATPRPLTSNVNFVPQQAAPNLAIVPVGSNGAISLYNWQGSVDVVVDVVGFFSPSGLTLYHPMAPVRAMDSRTGLGVSSGWGPSTTRSAVVGPNVGVPTSAVSIVGNLTGVNQTTSTYETVWPMGSARPLTSSLNLVVGDPRSNALISRIGASDSISIYNQYGTTDLLFDVSGWFE